MGDESVYPRVCGGTASLSSAGSSYPGLSPRVRGNLYPVHPLSRSQRSIPACAGEPSRIATVWHCFWVYPRVCGGTNASGTAVAVPMGLSPRVRGNHAAVFPLPCRYRSIPACAGEPSAATASTAPPGVYPRVCGGTRDLSESRSPSFGLSPRVRGNRAASLRALPLNGSIPACAGEPDY